MNFRSAFSSKKYPNLYKYPTSPNWVFRKYSKEKRREFTKSTGIRDDEARAYRIGLQWFNDWMGARIHHSGRDLLIRDIARAVIAGKEGRRFRTYYTAKNQIENHILPYFGHLRPAQITSLKWDNYDREERSKGKRSKLFNTRKALLEILNRACDEDLIKTVPKLKNHDGESRQGKYLDEFTVQTLIVAASPDTSLLLEILYLMGPRPGEVIQWHYDMIRWDEGPHGTINIPGRITKTGRSRTIPLNSRVSGLLWFRMHEQRGKHVFASRIDSRRPIREYKTGWNTAVERAALSEQNIITYDLRHTWITNQARRGIPAGFTAKYSDTSPGMIHKIYLKALPDSMQEVAG